uniref:VP n=1 Tax=Turdus hortulorum parvoviridae sp. TaxID=2794538 RepID=A0A8A4XCB8_9VIRU|nr:MAG: VP [Turdus hortulorum parvoviridae sp.]
MPKRKRDPSTYNPKERNKIGAYYARKAGKNPAKKAGGASGGDREFTRDDPYGNGRDEPDDLSTYGFSDIEEGAVAEEGERDDDDDAEMLAARTGGGGMGGGGAGGALGTQERGDRPFGSKCPRYTKTYTKSFTVFIDNGVGSLNIVETPGTDDTSPSITWNEGWSIIPWGFMEASLTPGDFAELAMTCKRVRVKSCSVEIEGMIPFQETVQTGGNVAVATASNRPNVWFFKDSTEMLPKLRMGQDVFFHSNNFQLPYGNYSATSLKKPAFVFENMSISASSLKLFSGAITATLPQQYFSLLGTGRVKTVYPGQKIKESWTNPVKTWQIIRLPWDSQDPAAFGTAATPDAYQQGKNAHCGLKASEHIGGRTNGIGVLEENGTVGPNSIVNHYCDTHLGLKEGGPPYLLMKVEPYFDTQDNALQIYMQAHVHYSMTIECEGNEHFNSFAPFSAANQRPTDSYDEFNFQWRDMVSNFGAGNELNTRYGKNQSNYLYS